MKERMWRKHTTLLCFQLTDICFSGSSCLLAMFVKRRLSEILLKLCDFQTNFLIL